MTPSQLQEDLRAARRPRQEEAGPEARPQRPLAGLLQLNVTQSLLCSLSSATATRAAGDGGSAAGKRAPTPPSVIRNLSGATLLWCETAHARGGAPQELRRLADGETAALQDCASDGGAAAARPAAKSRALLTPQLSRVTRYRCG